MVAATLLLGLAILAIGALASCTNSEPNDPNEQDGAATPSVADTAIDPASDAGASGADRPSVEDLTPGQWVPLGEPGVGGRSTSLTIDPDDGQHVLVGGDMLGIVHSDDGGESWTRSEGLLSLEVSQFTHHPTRAGEVWVGTMSGPHVSFDGGRTWEPRRTGLPPIEDFFYSAPIEVVVIDVADPSRLLAFGGSHREWQSLGEPEWGAVWESTDDGDTWGRIGTIADGTNVLDVVQLADESLVAVAIDRGIHRSIDGGRTWSRSDTGLPHENVRDLAAVPGTTVVYAALGAGPLDGPDHLSGGVYRSDDGGVTWEARSTGLGVRRSPTPDLTSRYVAIEISPVDPDVMWTADLAFGSEAVYRSDDGGNNWKVELPLDGRPEPATEYSSPVTAEILVADDERTELRFLAQSEYVLRRTSEGRWEDATSIAAGEGRAGTGYSGLVPTAITFDPVTPGAVLLNSLDGGQLLSSLDDGATWTRPLTEWDPWGGAQSTAVVADTTYVLLGQFGNFNGIAVSTDARETWAFVAGPDVGLPERGEFVDSLTGIAALTDDPSTVVATIGGSLYSSTDAGSTWTRILEGTYASIVPAARGEMFVADADGVFVLDVLTGEIRPIPEAPVGVDNLIVDRSSGALYAIRWGVDDNTSGLISRWDGSDWTQLCLDAPCGSGLDRYAADLAIDPTDPDHLLVATDDLPFHDEIGSSGVLESFDGGATWTELNDGLPIRRVGVIEIDPHRPDRLIIGTTGGGFYQMRLPG